MNQLGFLPNMSSMFHDVEKDEREHSEKLEIIFWLLNKYPGTYILVSKNLHVCDDYHSAIKFISNVSKLKKITRDMNCFRHFKDGNCSCGIIGDSLSNKKHTSSWDDIKICMQFFFAFGATY